MAQKLLELTSVETLENGGFDIAPYVQTTCFWMTDDWREPYRLLHQRKILGKAAVIWHADASKVPDIRKNIKTKQQSKL